jgi:cardiolipin synthase
VPALPENRRETCVFFFVPFVDNLSSKMKPIAISKIDRTQGLKKTPPVTDRQQTGTASGINLAPGSDDDGWIIPEPVRLSDGTLIQLYKDGEAWHAAFEAIRRAKVRICLELYIFASDQTGQAVADLLSEKARAGVKVFVIYDSFGSLYSDRAMFDKMRHAGVNVQQFHPMRPWECRYGWRAFNRDHRKLLLIDDDIAGLGGMNLGQDYAGSWIVKSAMAGSHQAENELWRDNAIGIRGPTAKTLLESFARTWNYVQKGGRIRSAELIHDIYKPGEFGVLASVPTTNSPLKPAVCHLLQNARRSICLTMAYFAPDDTLIDELCKAADRGVKIKLMLPGRGDIKLLVIAARSFYEKLMSHGIEIYERQQVILHAKTIVVDSEISIIGSTNLDYRSIEYNCELSAVIRSNELGHQIEMLFDNDVRYSRKIDPDVWQHRPHWDRFGQWVVSRARYLL